MSVEGVARTLRKPCRRPSGGRRGGCELALQPRHPELDRGRGGLRPDEADLLHQRGNALARAGDRLGAAGAHAEARELYARHGAGAAWLELVTGARR